MHFDWLVFKNHGSLACDFVEAEAEAADFVENWRGEYHMSI